MILEKIRSPRDLEGLAPEQLPELAWEIREEIVRVCAKNGGHLSSSLGATDIAVPLARLAQTIDYQVVVSDARRAFLREERFPGALHRLGWPQDLFTADDFGPSWAIVVLFHDPKFDIPALTLALQSQAFYIGFLGSRKTQAERKSDLLQAGFTEEDWARVHGPVGLNIGGKRPGLIALSILAEIVAVRYRRPGGMFSQSGA